MIHRRTLFLLLLLYSSISPISAADTSKLPEPNPPPSNGFGDIALTDYLSSTSNFPALLNSGDTPALRPSLALIVGISTTVLFITFLLLLYAKHCKRPPNTRNASNNLANIDAGGGLVRKNSGVDRSVIESLPLFRFSSLRGNKDGLECAVCLNRFNNTEVLRLLPKCRHAFHADCVDTWLDVHSTCPLCRHRIHPEDVLIAIEDCGDDDELEEGEPPMAPHEVCNNALSESPGTPTGDAFEEPRHPGYDRH
ncbi:unnamed protein product [Linum trigynum]|uniref:RING-type E3 ubiquitin transferase n=1 Tax=Linum trigynum TaxID=586398 RepID=A0AAV2G7S2_9ROSI